MFLAWLFCTLLTLPFSSRCFSLRRRFFGLWSCLSFIPKRLVRTVRRFVALRLLLSVFLFLPFAPHSLFLSPFSLSLPLCVSLLPSLSQANTLLNTSYEFPTYIRHGSNKNLFENLPVGPSLAFLRVFGAPWLVVWTSLSGIRKGNFQ